MIRDAPLTADALRREAAKLNWWHRIDLGHGVVTPGRDDSPRKLATIRMPERLDGLSVLDIGAWDGFFSFEAERRGAARVVAADGPAWEQGPRTGRPCFELARRALQSNVEDVHIDVMDLTPDQTGSFDLVLFLGVLYHLRHPLRALEAVASVTRGTLILETHVDLLFTRRPAVAFYPGDELNGDPSNYCGPNERALIAMLRDVGFDRVEIAHRRSFPMRLAQALKRRVRAPTAPFLASLQQGRVALHARKSLESPAQARRIESGGTYRSEAGPDGPSERSSQSSP